MDSKKVESFRDLVVWQKSHALVKSIYENTQKFPKREHPSLVLQFREAANALPINIAMGFNKRGKKNKLHYYRVALSTLESVRYFLILSRDLGFYKTSDADLSELETIEKMLKRLIRSVASAGGS